MKGGGGGGGGGVGGQISCPDISPRAVSLVCAVLLCWVHANPQDKSLLQILFLPGVNGLRAIVDARHLEGE